MTATAERRSAERPADQVRGRATSTDVAIVLSAVAAMAHLVAVPDHLRWWPASGYAFVVIGALQATLAILLLRTTSTNVILAGLVGNVAVVLLYLVSRTVGLPFSPGVPLHGAQPLPGMPRIPDGDKAVGPLDLLALLAELGTIVVLLGHLPRRARSREADSLLWCGLAIWSLAVLGALT